MRSDESIEGGREEGIEGGRGEGRERVVRYWKVCLEP